MCNCGLNNRMEIFQKFCRIMGVSEHLGMIFTHTHRAASKKDYYTPPCFIIRGGHSLYYIYINECEYKHHILHSMFNPKKL
jgi:hypothetical protein